MDFNATSTNLTELLVACLAVIAAVALMRKRYDSNMPLLFYFTVIMFNSMSEREINPYVLYTGVVLAMLLRFEFMGAGFAKFVATFSTLALCVMIFSMMSDVFA
jgi:predicted tellurium resistance membrane protein TerC